MLKEHLEHIKEKERLKRVNYGSLINVLNYDGQTTCLTCGYDEMYKTGIDPNCPTCKGKGLIFLTSDHYEKVTIDWITGEELEEIPAGMVHLGDCRLSARKESLSYFDNAIKNQISLDIEGKKMKPISVFPTTLRTTIIVYCVKKEE